MAGVTGTERRERVAPRGRRLSILAERARTAKRLARSAYASGPRGVSRPRSAEEGVERLRPAARVEGLFLVDHDARDAAIPLRSRSRDRMRIQFSTGRKSCVRQREGSGTTPGSVQ